MGQKTISGWTPKKQELLNEIKQKTGTPESEIIRQALGFYQLFLGFEEKYYELVRVRKRGRPKKSTAKSMV